MTATSVALIGASGHGATHRRVIGELADAGQVRLVGLCDIAEIPDPPLGVPCFTDHRELLAAARPDVVIVCTPPHTHLEIAVTAAEAGADVLLEKPPVLDLVEHDALLAAFAETGRACQVGFQALGSAALARLRASIDAGELGTITSIAARGAWFRPDSYFRRAAWVGRRTLGGRPVLDGALVNPFAHAVMQVLAIASYSTMDSPASVEVERYQANDIEVDDTASLRLRWASGLTAVVAVTLCARDFVPGDITVTGTAGTAVLEYPTDRLRLPGSDELTAVPGRIGLLANLLAHRADPTTPLLVPAAVTRPFTALLAPILATAPVAVDPGHLHPAPDHIEIVGVNAAIDAAVAGCSLFSELADVPWAKPCQEQP